MSSAAAPPAGARPRVLMLSPYFPPAEQGGGSVQAVLNLTRHLRDDFEFVVATRDHDLRGTQPFSAASQHAARQATGLDIHYLAGGMSGARQLHSLLRQPFDLVYLHSLMAPDLGLWPLLCRRWLAAAHGPLLVAPRGELMPGALAQRSRAKRVYLALLRGTGLLRGVQFHATGSDEAQAIQAALGGSAPPHVAADLPPPQLPATETDDAPRRPGPLRVLFLSRIDPVKNLGFALKVVSGMSCEIEFDIAGPIGNDQVWADCQGLMRALPAHIRTRYLGAVAHAEVAPMMAAHDVFFLPTLGENHGYVVAEALAAGCPVLLSDRTPWRGLQSAGVGADLPLDDVLAFQRVLATQAAMSNDERREQRARCRTYAQQRLTADASVAAMRELLTRLAQPNARIVSTSAGQSGGR
ncbi:glycosyltransferase family 4 protein [Roseateles asaccharophilus]|uniref:Glycosyltransferase involved in cell wall biosynthesis n=1 Tax=Roseateles asaccharophilus TaxID=582607 RepID=A0ABU2AC05_9BURK|nr:glycosyltransferase family 4 protein [Roseateles asaccharophilus]MDR7334725.1 glycosyltransferase involved in cell wall biosynthesis [Roseateles asaccharophilus]